ncbi:MAG: hypothetical protein SVK54_02100 [candidate division WOR-3 bacterium]|nr:hypothetical protein [candidate division WOR-3 bacterium]
MSFVWDPVNIINIILCTVIVIMGFMAYKRGKKTVALFIAIAFLIFDISHLVTFFGLADSWEAFLMIIRTLGYLTVVLAMYQSVRSVKQKAGTEI